MTATRHPLSQELDAIAHRLYPLALHPGAAAAPEVRDGYTLLLAATLGGGPISDVQERLLRSLLAAVDVIREPAVLLNAAGKLQRDALFTTLQAVREAGLAETLLVDALMLARIGAPLAPSALQMFSELAQALRIADLPLNRLVEWVNCVLFGQMTFSQPLLLQVIPPSIKLQMKLYGMLLPSTLKRGKVGVSHGQFFRKGTHIANFSNDEGTREQTHNCLSEHGVALIPAGEKGDIYVLEFPRALIAWFPLIDIPALLAQAAVRQEELTS